MDAEDRAELDRLRRLVYGPGGDASPAATERLAALEAKLRAEPPASPPSSPSSPRQSGREHPTPSKAPAVAEQRPEPSTRSGTLAARPDAERRPDAEPRRARLRTVLALIAVVIGVLAAFRLMAELPRPEPEAQTEVVSTRAAWSLARDPDAVVIERIPVGTEAGDSADAPWFPTSGTITEAVHVATLYGWEVWSAEANGIIQRESCLAVRRLPVVRGRCVPAVLRSTNVLAVDLSYSDIAATARPRGMTDAQRVGFWRTGDSGIWVMLADESPLP